MERVAAGNSKETATAVSPPLSKRQKKRLAKHEKWMQLKPLKRAQERERLKASRAQKKARGESLGPNRKLLKSVTMEKSPCRLRVVIDLSFDHLMTDRDIIKALKQVQNCYATNRRSSRPLQLFLTSYNGKSKEGLESRQNCNSWDVHFRENHYLDTFERESVVYLTSDSPNILETLDDDKVYVIGGLVDHNQHKGLCYRLAMEKGIGHGRLPLDQHVRMKTRQVLPINHVFQILSKWTEGVGWEAAFLSTLPPRKGAATKDVSVEAESDDVEDGPSKYASITGCVLPHPTATDIKGEQSQAETSLVDHQTSSAR